MLEVNNIYKEFGAVNKKKIILKGISFYIKNNEIVSITGKSGEGKSTIARIICGIVRPESGSIIYNEKRIVNGREKYDYSIYPEIQIIPQQPFLALDPKQRVGDAIAEPILKHKLVKNKKQVKSYVVELLKKVWLDESIIDRYPSQISGGQAQRIVIARAISVNPGLLISDESTSMLDILSQSQVISIYRELMKNNSLSILFISHDKELVNNFSHRQYELKNSVLSEIRGE